MKTLTSLQLAAAVPILAFGLVGIVVGTESAEQQRGSTAPNVMEERADSEGNDVPRIHRMPDHGLHGSDLIEKKIHSRESDDEIGEINDLVIDQTGRIIAVVIGTGSGVLGIGGKNVAIAWERIERTTEDGEVKLYIAMNEDTLQEEPKYERD